MLTTSEAAPQSPPNPIQFAERLPRVAANLEKLAADFRGIGETLRGHLNAVLCAGDLWEALFQVGGHIPRVPYARTHRLFGDEGGPTPTARAARYAVAKLIDSVVPPVDPKLVPGFVADRAGFDALLADLKSNPIATTEAELLLPEYVCWILNGYYLSQRYEFCTQADAVLAPLGPGKNLRETHTVEEFRRDGITITDEAERTLNYWFDPFGNGVCLDPDGLQLLPFGTLPPTLAPTEDSPPAEPDSVHNGTQERGEGAEPPPVGARATERTELPQLGTTEVDILKTMLRLKATGQTRKTTRDRVAQTINRTWTIANVSRKFQRLGKELGYTLSASGPDGGVWLSIQGKRVAEQLQAEE